MSNKWKSPEIIVGIIGLLLSLIGNFLQYNQNIKSDKLATQEAARADRADAKAENLIQQKLLWLNNLRKELGEVNKEIEVTRDNITMGKVNSMSTTYWERRNSYEIETSNAKRLIQLKAKKEILKEQIQDLLL
jgi:hypothetical protein